MTDNSARKSSRRRMGAPAWIRPDNAFSMRKCQIADISATGVRLFVNESMATMRQFVLLMSRDATQGCSCRVKWRRGNEIGAEFLSR
jgi:PilZ domain